MLARNASVNMLKFIVKPNRWEVGENKDTHFLVCIVLFPSMKKHAMHQEIY